MNYKELLNRYKKGLATEEEKRLIEKELEKYEAFEEYFSESFDEEFDDIVNISSDEIHDEETIKLKKNVNKRLRKVVFSSVLTIIVLYIGIFYVASGIVDRLYYDPTYVTQPLEQEYQFTDFYYDMQAHISLNMPGHALYPITLQESKGFGNYELSYAMKDLFTENVQRYFVDFSRNKITHEVDGIFSGVNRSEIWEGFGRIENDTFKGASIYKDENLQKKNEETIYYLSELNPLSYISMSIVFKEDLTMEEFYHMSREYPSIDFKWVGVRATELGSQYRYSERMRLIGFNPNSNDEVSYNWNPDSEEYPIFNLADMRGKLRLSEREYPEAISEAYEIHFRSRLKYLKNQEEFVKYFDFNNDIDFYEDALAYIDENGIKTYGVLAFGTADEFLENIDKIPYDTIYINRVLPANPNIYHD